MRIGIQRDTIARALYVLRDSANGARLVNCDTDDGIANVLISEVERLQMIMADMFSQTECNHENQ